MRSRVPAIASALLLVPTLLLTAPPAHAQEITGDWTLTRPAQPAPAASVQLVLTRGDVQASHGASTPVVRLEGLSPAQLSAGGSAPARFRIRGEAGTVSLEGTLREGSGWGRFRFAADPAFAAALEQRTLDRPTPTELFRLTLHGGSLAAVDALLRELATQGSARPSTGDLVRLLTHGIEPRYVVEMADAGHRGLSADELVRLHSHEVGPTFVGELRALGYGRLASAELVRLRSHGITPAFIAWANDGAGTRLPVHTLVRLHRDGEW